MNNRTEIILEALKEAQNILEVADASINMALMIIKDEIKQSKIFPAEIDKALVDIKNHLRNIIIHISTEQNKFIEATLRGSNE